MTSEYVGPSDRTEIAELVAEIRKTRDELTEADYRLIASTVFLRVSTVKAEVEVLDSGAEA